MRGPWEVHGFMDSWTHGLMDSWTHGPMDLWTVSGHCIRKYPQSFHLDLDDVAGLEEDGRLAREANAGRRAGRDDVAGLQRNCLRQEGHQGVDAEDELIRVR